MLASLVSPRTFCNLCGVIRRFSSRLEPLGHSFLADRLANAISYDRIAGYFSSSILEIAGEQIEAMSGVVRIVCNSELDADDIQSARAAERRRFARNGVPPIRSANSNGVEKIGLLG